jgi:hypothetical protein
MASMPTKRSPFCAFDPQETDTKLRVLAANVAAELPSIGVPAVSGALRDRVDRLLSTAHEQAH